MSVIPEILASVVPDPGINTAGRVLFTATEHAIKAKWSELLALGMRPSGTYRYIPKWDFQGEYKKYNKIFTYLQCYYPSSEIVTKSHSGISVPFIKVFPLQVSYVMYVAQGTLGYPAYRALKEAWTSNLLSLYLDASQSNSIDEFYDDYVGTIVGLRSGIGRDSRNDVDLIDTWLWGPGDLSIGFATRINGLKNSDYNNIIAGEDYLNIDNINGDISDQTLNEIKDKNKKFNPRRNKGVSRQNIYKSKKDIKEDEE